MLTLALPPRVGAAEPGAVPGVGGGGGRLCLAPAQDGAGAWPGGGRLRRASAALSRRHRRGPRSGHGAPRGAPPPLAPASRGPFFSHAFQHASQAAHPTVSALLGAPLAANGNL